MRHLSVSILALSATLFAATTFAAVDTLKLKIVNDTPYTLVFQGAEHAGNVGKFNLADHTIKSKNTVYFNGTAMVSSTQLDGLGGTMQFKVVGKNNKVLESEDGFTVGDNAIGWAHMPIFGFGVQDKYVQTKVTNVTVKKDPKSYDLAVKSATVTISKV